MECSMKPGMEANLDKHVTLDLKPDLKSVVKPEVKPEVKLDMSTNDPQAISVTALVGKSVLITGTTGFVGKVVLEKLLRTVPDIGQIYLLIRGNKRYASARNRFYNEVANSSIFDALKGADPDAFLQLCESKLSFVEGELTAAGFGLPEAEFAELANSLDLVINSAASVNFREALDDALSTNTLSLYTLIRLVQARQIPLVHVSTCYVNGFNKGMIEETVGKPAQLPLPRRGFAANAPYQVEPLIADLQAQIAELKQQYDEPRQLAAALVDLGMEQAQRCGWNDTYTFTKWLGEQILLQHLQGQGLTILRPSIVESTLFEPAPGWIEGVKVADAIIMAYARQKVTFFPGNRKAILDIIPADLVANSIILAAAETQCASADQVAHRIYQCSSSAANPVSIQQVIDCVIHEGRHNHQRHANLFARQPRRPFMMVPGWLFQLGSRLAYAWLQWKQRLPGWLGAGVSDSRLSNLDAAMKLALVFSFYTRPRYRFSNHKLCGLLQRVVLADQMRFPVDARLVDWSHYLCNIHIAGLNRYALKPRRSRRGQVAPQPATA